MSPRQYFGQLKFFFINSIYIFQRIQPYHNWHSSCPIWSMYPTPIQSPSMPTPTRLFAVRGVAPQMLWLGPSRYFCQVYANGLTPLEKMDEKLKSENIQKSSFLCLCYTLRAIGAGRCRERRYADHIFIQIYFRMHHFVVEFSKFSSPQAARGHWPP